MTHVQAPLPIRGSRGIWVRLARKSAVVNRSSAVLTVALAFAGAVFAAAPARAIEWPLDLAAVQRHVETSTSKDIVADRRYEFEAQGVLISIRTPFRFAEFVYSSRRALGSDVTDGDRAQIRAHRYVRVTAVVPLWLLGTTHRTSGPPPNDMVQIAFEQRGRTIQPSAFVDAKYARGTCDERFRVETRSDFGLDSFDLRAPLTVVLRDHESEVLARWHLDPTSIE